MRPTYVGLEARMPSASNYLELRLMSRRGKNEPCMRCCVASMHALFALRSFPCSCIFCFLMHCLLREPLLHACSSGGLHAGNDMPELPERQVSRLCRSSESRELPGVQARGPAGPSSVAQVRCMHACMHVIMNWNDGSATTCMKSKYHQLFNFERVIRLPPASQYEHRCAKSGLPV